MATSQSTTVAPNGRIDATGSRHGRLVGLKRSGKNQHGQSLWMWQCDCGQVVERALNRVRRGDTSSCGCYAKEFHATKIQRIKLAEGEASFNMLYDSYRKRAAKSSRDFTLTREHFRKLTGSPCHYCGVPPQQKGKWAPGVNGLYIFNGIDRVDNAIGYTLENSVPCCIFCNRAKGTWTHKEFIEWVSRLSTFQRQKQANTETLA